MDSGARKATGRHKSAVAAAKWQKGGCVVLFYDKKRESIFKPLHSQTLQIPFFRSDAKSKKQTFLLTLKRKKK